MASKIPPVKNAGYTFRIALFAQSNNQIKTTPTIAAGDFKVCTDGGALANPGTLPSESPASSGLVLITLTAAEMNGDEVVVTWADAAGDEWHSGIVVIHTAGQTFDALPTATENADELLKRDWTSVTGEAARSALNALRSLRNKVSVSAGTLTVTEEDDTTSAWTAAVTTSAAADPITEVDPA